MNKIEKKRQIKDHLKSLEEMGINIPQYIRDDLIQHIVDLNKDNEIDSREFMLGLGEVVSIHEERLKKDSPGLIDYVLSNEEYLPPLVPVKLAEFKVANDPTSLVGFRISSNKKVKNMTLEEKTKLFVFYLREWKKRNYRNAQFYGSTVPISENEFLSGLLTGTMTLGVIISNFGNLYLKRIKDNKLAKELTNELKEFRRFWAMKKLYSLRDRLYILGLVSEDERKSVVLGYGALASKLFDFLSKSSSYMGSSGGLVLVTRGDIGNSKNLRSLLKTIITNDFSDIISSASGYSLSNLEDKDLAKAIDIKTIAVFSYALRFLYGELYLSGFEDLQFGEKERENFEKWLDGKESLSSSAANKLFFALGLEQTTKCESYVNQIAKKTGLSEFKIMLDLENIARDYLSFSSVAEGLDL